MFMIRIIAREIWSLTRGRESAALEAERASAIVHLQNSSDRVLDDIGIFRDEIENAVRHGRAENHPGFDRRVA